VYSSILTHTVQQDRWWVKSVDLLMTVLKPPRSLMKFVIGKGQESKSIYIASLQHKYSPLKALRHGSHGFTCKRPRGRIQDLKGHAWSQASLCMTNSGSMTVWSKAPENITCRMLRHLFAVELVFPRGLRGTARVSVQPEYELSSSSSCGTIQEVWKKLSWGHCMSTPATPKETFSAPGPSSR